MVFASLILADESCEARGMAKAAESALKYFLLGAFSTCFLLYGIALVYGATGSTNLHTIGARIFELGLATNPVARDARLIGDDRPARRGQAIE